MSWLRAEPTGPEARTVPVLPNPSIKKLRASAASQSASAISHRGPEQLPDVTTGEIKTARAEAVNHDAEAGAGPQDGAGQVLTNGALAVQQVGTGAVQVVADHVGGHGGDRGPQRGSVRHEVVAEVDGAEPGQDVGGSVAGQPDEGPAVGEVDPGGAVVRAVGSG